jgi:hypothetical protein
MMRFYIPIGDGRYLCIENGKESRIVRGVPDPFSRVTCPPIRWSKVREDLPFCERKIKRASRSKIAYTILYEDLDE